MARPTHIINEVSVRVSPSVYQAAQILMLRDPEKYPNVSKAIEQVFEDHCPNEMRAGDKIVETMRDAVGKN